MAITRCVIDPDFRYLMEILGNSESIHEPRECS